MKNKIMKKINEFVILIIALLSVVFIFLGYLGFATLTPIGIGYFIYELVKTDLSFISIVWDVIQLIVIQGVLSVIAILLGKVLCVFADTYK